MKIKPKEAKDHFVDGIYEGRVITPILMELERIGIKADAVEAKWLVAVIKKLWDFRDDSLMNSLVE
jgi:hypothetical protein